MTKRVASGATIDIPLAHKDALYVRSHYDGITITLPDAPGPNEIAIICAYASRGRTNHRVGGLAAGEIKGADGLV
jgi:Amino acid synthesis